MTIKLLNTAELAMVLGISKNTIYNLLCKIRKGEINPDCLPAWIIVGRKRKWLSQTVDSWLRTSQTITSNEFERRSRSDCATQHLIKGAPAIKRKRGRPRAVRSLVNPLSK